MATKKRTEGEEGHTECVCVGPPFFDLCRSQSPFRKDSGHLATLWRRRRRWHSDGLPTPENGSPSASFREIPARESAPPRRESKVPPPPQRREACCGLATGPPLFRPVHLPQNAAPLLFSTCIRLLPSPAVREGGSMPHAEESKHTHERREKNKQTRFFSFAPLQRRLLLPLGSVRLVCGEGPFIFFFFLSTVASLLRTNQSSCAEGCPSAFNRPCSGERRA